MFGIVDAVAILAYYFLPDHSAELALSNDNPMGIVTHIFSHVSTLHVIGNAAMLLAFPVMLAIVGYMGAQMTDQGEQYLRFIGRWTVPLFFATSITSGIVAFATLSASGRAFTFSGMSDGVYGVAAGLAYAGFVKTFPHVRLGRPLPTLLRGITVILLLYVFWAIANSALGNLGHMLGVLSAIAFVTAIGVADTVTPMLQATLQERRLGR